MKLEIANMFRRQTSEGVFKPEFRKQLLAALSVTLITCSHGIGLGWVSPMLTKLQSPTDTPLDFTISIEEVSWIGAFVCVGGFAGNVGFGLLLNRIGRKASIYCLALPHLCMWTLVYFSSSAECLYVARFLGGCTGGGTYVVIPIFIGEIADSSIRGRLTSLFTLTLNSGILFGFILSSHLPYHLIPCLVAVLPLLYLFLGTLFPETPQHLLRCGHEERARESLQFYRCYKASTKEEMQKFELVFEEMKLNVVGQKSPGTDVGIRDFLTKRALKALTAGVLLMAINAYTGLFAIINYTSSIFIATGAQLHPDTNTIIIGVVQIIGTYTATILVDRLGRKILLLFSTASMGFFLAALGMFAFVAEETTVDLTGLSAWLPLLLVALITFVANIGVVSVPFIVLVEIMPPKIRAPATSFCVALLSVFAFVLLKVFPVFMDSFGLSATMWFCASFCAFGLFYVAVFLKETKGKSINQEEEEDEKADS